MTEDLLTVAEIAARLRVTTETARRYITALPPSHALPATRIGRNGKYLVEVSDLEAWLQRR